MSLLRRFLLPLLIALGATAAAAPFSPQNPPGFSASAEFLPVDEAFVVGASLASSPRVFWQIHPGYYLYRGRLAFALEGASEARLDPTVPSGLAKDDPYFGPVEVFYNDLSVALHIEGPVPEDAALRVSYQGCADAGLCYPPETDYLKVDVTNGTVTATDPGKPPARVTTPPATGADMTLLLAMGLAVLGGLILNAMPCVFPILSLKVLSFATGDPDEHRRHGLIYLAGVVSSFVLIAAVLIGLQSAGRWVGWGFQLQSTGFVIGLAYLFVLMGLSLSGLVLIGGRWMNLGAGLATAPGARGSFFTGVLAVVVASPCTAPFMGSALGFALTQPPLAALSVFAALGVGMALPMVAISSSATARAWLPKPGAWMDTLKQVMAFPLYLTAVWLLWVAGKQSGVDTMAAAAAGLVMLALGLTLLQGQTVARAAGAACLIGAVLLGGVRGDAGATATGERDGTVRWSPEALASLRAQGTPVFVDVTADWCITCLANEQAVLFTDEMTRAFADAGVTYMVADCTNYDPEIGTFVREHGRNGIPLYVMYAGNLQSAPLILPQILTTGIVRDALQSVSQ